VDVVLAVLVAVEVRTVMLLGRVGAGDATVLAGGGVCVAFLSLKSCISDRRSGLISFFDTLLQCCRYSSRRCLPSLHSW
jgi:hypothetical protein